jgi:hypothetical protein
MLKNLTKSFGLIIIVLFTANLMIGTVFAEDESASTPQSTTFKGICQSIEEGTGAYAGFPDCATTPAECGSNENSVTPVNCLFLEEPIGGEPGYDLYKITCGEKPGDPGQQVCDYTLWHGEAIGPGSRGPVQALLTYEAGKEYQAGLGLFYSYLGLIYKFMSGIIVGFVVLISIIGGITMTTSAGNQEQFEKGKTMIVKALIGMALWFLASVILYTINPTFFAF